MNNALSFPQLLLLRSSADSAHLYLLIVPTAHLGVSCALELITVFQMERTGETQSIRAGIDTAL